MTRYTTADDIEISYHAEGSGPPLLLLHGFPQNRHMWRRIAPALAERFTVVTADMRGYGASAKPALMRDMSFRAMGGDMLALMGHLGFERFHLAGHDRGARVAHRMTLDAPDRIAALVVMDIVPTHHLLTHMTTPVARAYYHWFFLAQPEPFPETLIGHDPDAYFERCLLGFGKASLDDFAPDLLAKYREGWRDRDSIRCMCNDYRAAIDVDLADDAADLDLRVACPTLVAYGAEGAMAKAMDVPATWTDRLAAMEHVAVPGGHFFPDQSPEDTTAVLLDFFERHSL